MFKNYTLKIVKSNENYYHFKITDDDFEEEICIERYNIVGFEYRGALVRTIVKCYEDKNLNVVANLFLFLINGRTTIKVVDIKYYLPEIYSKYENDFEKYLMLM